MNCLIALSDEEIEALQDWHAGKIGDGDEAESDRHCERIQQLERSKQTSHQYHDFEGLAA